MTALNRNPQNTNFLQATKFLLTFSRISNTQYFCQEINIPGISLGEASRSTPFIELYSPGTKLTYDPLNITFTIDETLQSWKDLYKWFISIADPKGFDGRINNKDYFSDATLTILSALNNPIIRIQFSNIFPVSINGINFDTKLDADHIITCTASFRFQTYEYLTT
jgi:hypothetical protein